MRESDQVSSGVAPIVWARALGALFILALASACSSETAGPVADTAIAATTSTSPPSTAESTTTVVTAEPTTTTSTTSSSTMPPPSTLPELDAVYAAVQSGVLEVEVDLCDGRFSSGTAFLVAPDEVLTAAHVVDDAITFDVIADGEPVGGTVLGADENLDIALVRLDRPVEGHVFELSGELPATGMTVAAIGFPLENPKTLTAGTISGTERAIVMFDGTELQHLIQTDVALNPGNSGGPVLLRDQRVVGIVAAGDEAAQGINYAATAAFAKPLVESWRADPRYPPRSTCVPTEPDPAPPVAEAPERTPLETLVHESLSLYFDGVNQGLYEQARLRLAPERRPEQDVWSEALSTTIDSDVVVHTIEPTEEGARVWVTFTSTQGAEFGPRPGETCTEWSIDYTMVPADDGLMWIADADGHAGGPISTPC